MNTTSRLCVPAGPCVTLASTAHVDEVCFAHASLFPPEMQHKNRDVPSSEAQLILGISGKLPFSLRFWEMCSPTWSQAHVASSVTQQSPTLDGVASAFAPFRFVISTQQVDLCVCLFR